MTKHESMIRKLLETPMGHPPFTEFIAHWEMNNEPLPPETVKCIEFPSDMWITVDINVAYTSRSTTMSVTWARPSESWKQKRRTISMQMTTKMTTASELLHISCCLIGLFLTFLMTCLPCTSRSPYLYKADKATRPLTRHEKGNKS